MAKVLNEDGSETVDGVVVKIYEGKFMGTFQMENETAAPISNNDQMTFLVTVRCGAPKFSYVTKTGDFKRLNTFKIEEALALDSDAAAVLYDALGEKVYGVNEGLIETSFVQPVEEQELGFDPSKLYKGDK